MTHKIEVGLFEQFSKENYIKQVVDAEDEYAWAIRPVETYVPEPIESPLTVYEPPFYLKVKAVMP